MTTPLWRVSLGLRACGGLARSQIVGAVVPKIGVPSEAGRSTRACRTHLRVAWRCVDPPVPVPVLQVVTSGPTVELFNSLHPQCAPLCKALGIGLLRREYGAVRCLWIAVPRWSPVSDSWWQAFDPKRQSVQRPFGICGTGETLSLQFPFAANLEL